MQVDETMNSEISLSPILEEVFQNGTVEHPDGSKIDCVANIGKQNCLALFGVVQKHRPKVVVEIGMAYGVSSLTILTALRSNGDGGRLISIDPYIGWSTGRIVALNQVRRAGFEDIHQHLYEPSYSGLPRLLHDNAAVDLVYIDGNHNFDYAFTDFFLADKLIKKGGVIGFNDCGWRSVFRVIQFLRRYRRYEELGVGLEKRFESKNSVFAVFKRLQGRSSADRYFQKLEDWEPSCQTLKIPGP